MSTRSWTESLARACARRPWLTVGIWAAAVVLAVFSMANLLGGALVTDAKPTNNPESSQAVTVMNERLGIKESENLDEMVIVRSDTLTVDDAAFRERVQSVYGDLAALGPETFLGGATYDMTQDPAMVSPDRHSTFIPFTMPPDGDKKMDQVYAIGDKYATDGFEVYHTGSAAFTADSIKLGDDTAQRGEMIGISVAIVILIIVFGAVAAALLPIALGVVAIVIALGLSALVGQTMDLTFMVTSMITMMGLAVGIDYSLFILTRFREERARGLDKMEAIGAAGATASRAIFFSGLTVMLALAGLVIFPLSIFISMGIGAILVVFAAITASLTLLPAMLSLFGDRVNAWRLPFIQRPTGQADNANTGFWARTTRIVTRAPVASLLITVAILGAAIVPFFDKETGMSGISGLPDYLPSKQGYMVLQRDFHIGMDEPTVIVIDGDINAPATQRGIAALQTALASDPAFAGATVEPHPDKNLALVLARPAGDAMALSSLDSIARLRTEYIPQAFGGAPVKVLVTGTSAGMLDFNETTSDYTPVIFGIVLALSFVVLILAFRSIVIPVTAIAMNLLSVGAAYGLIVLVFQKGVGADLFGFMQVASIETWLPLFLFAVLFGLSMDYHVFLLSRVRERYNRTKDNAGSVAFGLRSTGRLITGAAFIMVAVFGGFALGDMTMMQQMGFGLAVAVLVDATLVRCVLVPATMKLLGRHNWYLPPWLAWLPNISLGERPAVIALPAPEKKKTHLEPVPVRVPVDEAS